MFVFCSIKVFVKVIFFYSINQFLSPKMLLTANIGLQSLTVFSYPVQLLQQKRESKRKKIIVHPSNYIYISIYEFSCALSYAWTLFLDMIGNRTSFKGRIQVE